MVEHFPFFWVKLQNLSVLLREEFLLLKINLCEKYTPFCKVQFVSLAMVFTDSPLSAHTI